MTKSTFNLRNVGFAVSSFLLGACAFIKVTAVSGPVFEPIIAACCNPDYTMEEFVSETGYHAYEPKVGLGVFNVLVCLITQFLLELRLTYPAGLLVWCGVIIVSLPTALVGGFTEPGRAGVKGLIRYPTFFGLLYQLFGISIIFPLLWIPSYIYCHGKSGAPISPFRIAMAIPQLFPSLILTFIVFSASTESYLWTIAAGTLGGPVLTLSGLILWNDKSPSIPQTEQNLKQSLAGLKKLYDSVALMCFLGWVCLIKVTYNAYGTNIVAIWDDIWVNAGGSVAFMTIDTGVLYLALLLFVAYHSELEAMKALLITPFVGPAAICFSLKELEINAVNQYLKQIQEETKKKA